MDFTTLKENAKKSLANNYWIAVGASAVVTTINAAASGVSGSFSRISGAMAENGDPSIGIMLLMLFLSLIGFSLSIAVTLCVTNILNVGQASFYLKLRKANVDFMSVFNYYQNGNFMKVFKAMIRKTIYIFLWSLLCVIPGIVMGLAYFMVEYIVAENPDIDSQRAIDISKATMDGEKGNLFLLQLSFIGWVLLALLTCGIGMYFLAPYMNATYAEFYELMKAKAINNGIARPEEFGINPADSIVTDAPII